MGREKTASGLSAIGYIDFTGTLPLRVSNITLIFHALAIKAIEEWLFAHIFTGNASKYTAIF